MGKAAKEERAATVDPAGRKLVRGVAETAVGEVQAEGAAQETRVIQVSRVEVVISLSAHFP
ncbi:hypothetical protein PMN64_42385 [Bradyrhizobium sp. UFLA01-814]|uniref:hypothetical protein n=1 Tax=Bradyrhizobium sp. UFLA01-814 TaxID=3023480 RepID=UPI00398A5FFF